MATYYSRLKVNIDPQRQNLYSQFFYIIRVYKDRSLTEILPVIPPPILTPFSQDWRTVDTKIENASEQTRIYYDIYHNGIRIHKDIRGRRLGLPYTQDSEKNTTLFTIKTTSASTTTGQGNIKQQRITQPNNQTKVAIFYVGGAADKKAWKGGQGPNHNIVDTQREVNKFIKNNNLDNSRYEEFYIGYYEIYSRTQREAFINQIDKSTKVIIIGHSLGGWNGTHFARTFSDSGYTVEHLITIDPVGEGLGVTAIADVIISYPPAPRAKKWHNVREIGSGIAYLVAAAGGRWVPGYHVSNVSRFLIRIPLHTKDRNPIFPDYSYISEYGHEVTYRAIYDKSKLHKINPDYDPDYQNWEIIESPAQSSPFNSLTADLLVWLKK